MRIRNSNLPLNIVTRAILALADNLGIAMSDARKYRRGLELGLIPPRVLENLFLAHPYIPFRYSETLFSLKPDSRPEQAKARRFPLLHLLLYQEIKSLCFSGMFCSTELVTGTVLYSCLETFCSENENFRLCLAPHIQTELSLEGSQQDPRARHYSFSAVLSNV